MITMKINVSPEQAIKIAEILREPTTTTAELNGVVAAAPQTIAATISPAAANAQQTPPTAPPAQPTVQQPVVQPPIQAAPPVQAPPVAERKYTQNDLALASRPICEAGRQQDLLNLLHSFTFTDNSGNTQAVQCIQQLPEESYPAFANGIRALGGRI